jgi:competence protein ComEA
MADAPEPMGPAGPISPATVDGIGGWVPEVGMPDHGGPDPDVPDPGAPDPDAPDPDAPDPDAPDPGALDWDLLDWDLPAPDDRPNEDDLRARWAPPSVGGRHSVAGVADELDPADELGPDDQWHAESEHAATDADTVARPPHPAPGPDDDAAQDISDEAEDLDVRTRPRAHRINGRWGRFAELWVPEPLRNARIDPGRRGMIVLVLVAAIAAVATAVGVWRDRPEPRPVETSVVAAVGELSASPSAILSPAAATGAGPVPATPPPSSEILVSVTGLVVNPGVVRLPAAARVADAITAAGGTQAGANLTGMNLAAKLADGDSVVVTDTPAAAGPAPAAAGGAAGASGGSASSPGLVNLNTADEAALDTLPGVGPVMAQNIIAWRNSNGKFSSIEQLQEISGIGPSRYAQISGLVTVG